MDNQGAATLLRYNALFGGLTEEDLNEVVALGHSRAVKKGESLYLQGDPGTTLYLIVSGEVVISANSPEGQEMHLNTLTSGDIMGEIALLDGGTRTASATVNQDGLIFCIERSDFLALLERQPHITTQLLKLVCQRVRWTSGLLEDSVFLTAQARLAKRLLSIAQAAGTQVPDGFEIRLSQTDLARYLNLTRQVVNQLLQGLQKDGVVTLGHRKVTIHDQEALLGITLS